MNFITYDLRRVEQPSIRTMGKETDSVDLELGRLADLLAYLIENYGNTESLRERITINRNHRIVNDPASEGEV